VRDEQKRSEGLLRQVSERAGGARCAPLARRPRPAYLRERVGGCLEALGRAHEDDPQRVSTDALAEGGARPRGQAHGGLLLRRSGGAPSRVCAPANEVTTAGRAPPNVRATNAWVCAARRRRLRADSR